MSSVVLNNPPVFQAEQSGCNVRADDIDLSACPEQGADFSFCNSSAADNNGFFLIEINKGRVMFHKMSVLIEGSKKFFCFLCIFNCWIFFNEGVQRADRFFTFPHMVV